ncbi:MAG: lamin tail domain-containing protein, partial [Patescibacteria group bacterium]|nr:lamin tail domain-containing protein [Patescibacteria group bacterium]
MKGLARTKNKRHKQLLATLLLLTFFFIHPPAARASPETILINEVMYDPDGADSGYEWLELINLSDSTVNLEGWTIQVAGNSFADKTELPEYWIEPGSIVLVGEPNVPDTDIIVPSLS